jgi:hypothetical protein
MPNYNSSLTITADTVPPKAIRTQPALPTGKTLPATNTPLPNTNDTLADNSEKVDSFNIQFSKDSLQSPVDRQAADSAIFLVKEKKFLLYGGAKTNYEKNDIDADYILMDNKEQIVFARGRMDSVGKITDQLRLKMDEQNITADSVLYSIKTGKAITHKARTTNDELYIQSDKIKTLEDKKSFYGLNNRFTTCNLDEPHFCFKAKRIKVVSGDLAVTGFTNPEIEGVPLPIGLPFGLFPLKKGRKGGLLPPQFTANEELGIGLEGLGYYFNFKNSPYFDLTVRSNIYSYGSWNAMITPTYRKRYKYNGGLNINIQRTHRNFKGDANFEKGFSFNIGWNHSIDTRARPGVTFSANVNAGTSSFNKNIPNDPFRQTQNSMNSSISWSKTWQNKMFGQDNTFNLTSSANHNQNTNNNSVQLNFPTVTFSMQNTFPFAKKNRIGAEKWYERIGFAYTGNLRSEVAFFDNQPIKDILRTIRDTFKWGADHSIPITMSLPALGPIQLAPSVSYAERTYGQKIVRTWNTSSKKVDTVIYKGLYQARQMSFGLSSATALYGTFKFKSKRLLAARHTIRPNVGLNYTPNMNKRNTYDLQLDTTGYKQSVSVFDGNLFSAFGSTRFGGITFGIDNNIELKVRKKGDTTDTKIKLIDGFSINGGYNLLLDSFNLSSIAMSLRSTLFDGKLNITAGANIDPYQVNKFGRPVNKFAWQGGKFGLKSFGRITSANVALNTSFKGGDKTDDSKKNTPNRGIKNFRPLEGNEFSLDEQMQLNQYMNQNPAEFVDFNIPWDISLNAAITYSRFLQPNYTFSNSLSADINFQGNFSLTPKWKCGGSGFYDVKTGSITQIQMFLTREMHCWQMAINLVPIGPTKSFNFTINPKAGLLRDLKINRTRYFYNN